MDWTCIGCHGKELYGHERIAPIGGYGLLPGIGRFSSGTKFQIVVCMECGLIQFYASENAREQIMHSKKWRKL